MKDRYSISEAKNRLPHIVHLVEKGPPVHLTRHGRPVAVLVSAWEYEKLCRKGSGFWIELASFRKRTEKEGVVISGEEFAGLRSNDAGRSVDLDGDDR